MASSNIGSLVVNIEANLAKFSSDMGRAVHLAEQTLGRISNLFNALGVAIGGSGLVYGFAAIVRSSAELGAELTRGAQRAGIAAGEFSKLAAVAKANDVDMGSLERGIKNYQVAIASANEGNKTAIKAFADLGLNVQKLRGLDAAKQMSMIAEALRDIPNATDRAKLGTQLLGKAYLDLVPMLQGGAAGIRDMVREQEKLGTVMSDKQIDQLNKAKQSIDRMKASFSALATEIGSHLAPYMESFFGWLTKIMRYDPSSIDALTNKLRQMQAMSPGVERDRAVAYVQAELAGAKAAQATQQAADAAADAQAKLDAEAAAAKRLSDEMARLGRMSAAAAKAGTRFEVFAELKENIKWLDDLERATTANEETTRTSVEKEIAAWDKFNKAIEQQLQYNVINTQEATKQTQEYIDSILPEFVPTVHMIVKETKKATDQMSEFANEAARNMQDAFANFLFDPFHGGLKKMLLDFIQVIQRMVAEALAAQILKSMFGGAGGLGSILGGLISGGGGAATGEMVLSGTDFTGLATGGRVSTGTPYMVGERGPEMFVPDAAGSVMSNSSLVPAITMHYAPIIKVDSRADAAQVHADTARLVRQGNKDMLEMLQRYNPGLRS